MKKFQNSTGVALCIVALIVSLFNFAVDFIAGYHIAEVMISTRFLLIFAISLLFLFSSNTNYKIGRVIQIALCYFSGLFVILVNPFESAALVIFLISIICVFIYGYMGTRGIDRTIRSIMYFGGIFAVTCFSTWKYHPERYNYPIAYFILLFTFAIIVKYGYTFFHAQKKVYESYLKKSVNIANEYRGKINDKEGEDVSKANRRD